MIFWSFLWDKNRQGMDLLPNRNYTGMYNQNPEIRDFKVILWDKSSLQGMDLPFNRDYTGMYNQNPKNGLAAQPHHYTGTYNQNPEIQKVKKRGGFCFKMFDKKHWKSIVIPWRMRIVAF